MFYSTKNSMINLHHVCKISKYDLGNPSIKMYFSSGESSVEIFDTQKERDSAYKKLADECGKANDRWYPKEKKKELS